MRLVTLVMCVCFSVVLSSSQMASGPQKDPRLAAPQMDVGGHIDGHVVLADRGTVAWAATIAVRDQDSGLTRTVVSDEAGRFVFENLPPGKYFLRAMKAGYISTNFGATVFGKPPVAVVLSSGGRVEDITIGLQRAAVVSGQILEAAGGPATGLRVSAILRQVVEGELRYVTAGQVQSDDRGMFRFYDLPPGKYAIVASLRDLRSDRAPMDNGVDFIDAPIPSLPARPGQLLIRPQPPNTAGSYMNVFFPGTFDPANAAWLTVGPGEEKADTNFGLQLVRAGTIEGDVHFSDGSEARNARVIVNASPENASLGSGDFGNRAMTATSGHFSFGGIQPGDYTIIATTADGGSRFNDSPY